MVPPTSTVASGGGPPAELEAGAPTGRYRPFAASVVFGVYTLAFVVWALGGWGSPRERTVISDLAFLPAGPAAAFAAWRAARRSALSTGVRRGWRLIALALVSWGIGDLVWFFFEVVRDQQPFPSAADAFYLCFYPLLLAGLVVLAPDDGGQKSRARLLLDAFTVTVVGALVVWLVAIQPTVEQAGAGWLAQLLNVAYPVGDVLVVFGIAVVLLRRPPSSTATSLRVLMVGALAFVGADLAYARLSLSGSYEGGDFPDALWMVAIALFLVAADVQRGSTSRVPIAERHRTPTISSVPYAAVVCGFGILLFAARHERAEFVGLLVVAFVIAALVSARQLLALRDNVRLTHELERALAAAQAEEDRTRRFLADAAHHLRTPIAGVQACSDALLRGASRDQQEALLHSIGREASRAGRLVADLLAIARLDAGAPILGAPTDLVALCEQEAERLRTTTPAADVRVVGVDPPPDPVRGDPEALRTIIATLLDNAARHARDGVDVAVTAAGPVVEIRVRGDGPGIEPNAASQMFDRFVALDGEGGAGLGLAMAQGYARAHHGDLSYENGAFLLRLPSQPRHGLPRRKGDRE
jgi:signal transduction histidine kinase